MPLGLGLIYCVPQVAISQYWGGHMRFFRQLCTAAKVPAIEELAKQELAKGNCVVIGLQSTGQCVGENIAS